MNEKNYATVIEDIKGKIRSAQHRAKYQMNFLMFRFFL